MSSGAFSRSWCFNDGWSERNRGKVVMLVAVYEGRPWAKLAVNFWSGSVWILGSSWLLYQFEKPANLGFGFYIPINSSRWPKPTRFNWFPLECLLSRISPSLSSVLFVICPFNTNMTDKQSDFHLLDVENCLQLVFQSPQKLSRSKTMGHITTALELGKYAWED